jgi:hypothetical protein
MINLTEEILRIKQVMGLSEQFPEEMSMDNLKPQEVSTDDTQTQEVPDSEEQPKEPIDFSNSVVPQIVWRAGRVGVSPNSSIIVNPSP